MSFGTNMREARKSKGLTQQELAEMLDIAQATVAQYETGAKSPNVYIGAEIAKILGVTLDFLMK